MGDDIEQRVANSARELLLDRLVIEERRLILPDPPHGSDAASALARTCVHEAQEAMQVCLPLRRQIKLVTEIVDRLERFEGVLMLLRDPFNHRFTVGKDRHIHYQRTSEARMSKFQLADDQETAEVIDHLLPKLDAPTSRVPIPDSAPEPAGPPVGLQWMVHRELMSAEAADFLEKCVAARLNIVVSGELGAGRTTTVAALAALAPRDERVITIEESPEFALPLEHVVSLSLPSEFMRARLRVPVTLRDLVRLTWRMRPDRILLGEVRGAELYDLLDSVRCTQACTLTSVSARSPHEAIARLEQLAQSAVPHVPARDVLELVSETVDVVVHQERLPDGTRRVTSITELHGMAGDELVVRMIFEQDGAKLAPTGAQPSFQRVRNAPPPRPVAAWSPEPEEAGPLFHWVSHVAPRRMNPLRARQIGAMSGLSGEPPEQAEYLRLHLLLVPRVAQTPEVTAALNAPGDWRLAARAKVAVRACLDEVLAHTKAALSDVRCQAIVDRICEEVLGVGCIQPYLDDPAITAIMINGPLQIMLESAGRLTRAATSYETEAQVQALVDRYAPKPVFNENDSLSPTRSALVLGPPWLREGKLPDGTLLTAILPPASAIGPVVLLRKT